MNFRQLIGSDSRTRNVRKNTLWMFVIRGVSILISLLYVPLLLSSMNTAHYGTWLTLTSIISWVSLMDIGLGNGLRNKLSEAVAQGRTDECKKLISSAYGALALGMGGLILCFLAVSYFVPWDDVLNTHDIPADSLRFLVNVVLASFGLQFVLNLINSILYAFQKPALSSVITMMNNLLSFLSVLILVKCFGISDLIILGSTISIAPIIVIAVFSLIFFGGKYRKYCPTPSSFDKGSIKSVMGLGIKFFIIQIITIILYQTNNIIITHVVSQEAVVEYNIVYKYLSILSMAFTIVITPIWSATTDAYTRKDFDWIRRTSRTLDRLIFAIIVIGLLMVALSSVAFNLWLGKGHIAISFITTILVFLYTVFKLYYSSYGYFLNGMGKLHAQLVITSIVAVLYIPVTIFLGRWWGLKGIILSTILVNLINSLWSKLQFTRVLNGTTNSFWLK